MKTAISAPNSAWIKYWGNRNNGLRLPVADSFSMTLDSPTVEIDIDHSETLTVKSINSDGSERILKESEVGRFQITLDLAKKYLETLDVPEAIPASVALEIRSHIPAAVGLASSAAVFSCFARAIQGLIEETINLTDEQTSVIARLGSGSAARSASGGFIALRAGEGDEIGSAYGEQMADENHWVLHDFILVPSMEEKKVGSTKGHASAQSSPHFSQRVEDIMERRQKECIDAVLGKDFEKLQRVAEEDCDDMHRVMLTSNPPLDYLTDVTHRIVRDIKAFRDSEHLEVFYTMDAGPTVQLLCTEESKEKVAEFANNQEDCTIFTAKTGPGARLI